MIRHRGKVWAGLVLLADLPAFLKRLILKRKKPICSGSAQFSWCLEPAPEIKHWRGFADGLGLWWA
jgi:hypothetical protein